jgi:hypothetical protein
VEECVDSFLICFDGCSDRCEFRLVAILLELSHRFDLEATRQSSKRKKREGDEREQSSC